MIPIHLDPAHLRIGLIGNGKLALSRYNWLVGLDCTPQVWSPDPDATFVMGVGNRLHQRMPTDEEIAALSILWIADLAHPLAGELATQARAVKVIVNVEDDLPFCDFHTPALVTRGKLLVSIGTSGSSPAAAGFVRRLLEAALPMKWKDVLSTLSTMRQDMRREKAPPRTVIEAAQSYLGQADIRRSIAPCGRENCALVAVAHDAKGKD